MMSNLNSLHSSFVPSKSLKIISIFNLHLPAKVDGISKLKPVMGIEVKTSSLWNANKNWNWSLQWRALHGKSLTPAGIGQLLCFISVVRGYHGSTLLSMSKHISVTRRLISPLCQWPRSKRVLEIMTVHGSATSLLYFMRPLRTVSYEWSRNHRSPQINN